MFQGCFRDELRMIEGCFRDVLRMFRDRLRVHKPPLRVPRMMGSECASAAHPSFTLMVRFTPIERSAVCAIGAN